jgi:hypothetical protein
MSSYCASINPTALPSEAVVELVGMAGNAYTKADACPPFHLREFVENWLADGIAPDYCLQVLKAHLVSDSGLPWLDRLIRSGWRARTRPPRAEPVATSRLWKRLPDYAVDDGDPDYWSSARPDEERGAAPADAAPVKPIQKAVAFLHEELDGREVEATVVERNAERAGIALRTLDRARARLKVTSRRHGFGRGATFWLSLPPPRGAKDANERRRSWSRVSKALRSCNTT